MRLARPFHFAACAAIALGVGCLFWVPALPAAHGWFPTPLDDVYIHFDFARSMARGSPFEWIPGNGYSSGETSPLYAVILAFGYAIGFRRNLLGFWAAIVAVLGVASFVRSVRELARPAHPLIAWGAAVLPLSVAILDWTLFSGMEVAAFAGALGPALVALARTRAPHHQRAGATLEQAQWRLGAWGAVLVLLRPEAVVLALVFAIVATRGVLRRSAIAALARTSAPAMAATGAVMLANLVATGSVQSAGAQLKLLSSNPYLSNTDRARVFIENIAVFVMKGVVPELGAVPWVRAVLPLLALAALVAPSRRAIASACTAGALFWVLLVSWNQASPYHNFRYYAPALLLALAQAGLGAAALARIGGPSSSVGPLLGVTALAVTISANARRFRPQTTHFRRASANIRDQQVVAGDRLATMRGVTRVLLNDAGAIPYVSGRPAIDGLGLGGFRRLPFALAAVHGEAATLELLERLDPSERPTHLAVYPHWLGAISGRFGTEIDRVTIEDNVICAASSKVIYRADWSALGRAPAPSDDVIDEIDVADVISEREHAYRAPLPQARTSFDVLVDRQGNERFDAGRLIPEGESESFVVQNAGGGRARIVVRVDANAGPIRLRTRSEKTDLELGPVVAGRWREATAPIEKLYVGERIELSSERGGFRDYHVWIMRAF
ncbi:MAG: hypothetical protein JST00_39970 [Deltaproteobacteria bacterium]|nr:hypothetical protein [Deltaproteobacteria bacterium]